MIERNGKQYPNPTYKQSLEAWCLLNDLIKLGYPHDFLRGLPHIRSYMWKVTDLVRDAIHIRNGMENEDALDAFLRRVKTELPGKDIWIYSGFTLEELGDRELLQYADVLVDGPFVEELKDSGLAFRGSRNQRILHLKSGR